MSDESQETPVQSLSKTEKRKLLRRLNHRKKEVREEALREITASAEALPRLLELHEAAGKFNMGQLLPALCGFSCSLFGVWLSSQGWHSGIVLCFCGYGFLWLNQRSSRAAVALSTAIHKSSDVRALPFFIDNYRNIGSWGANEELITALFARLKMTDASLLHPRHRDALNQYLRVQTFYSVHIKVAILKAYQQIGDDSALETVRALLERNNSVSDWNEAIVRQAAEECLPYLQQNAGQVTQMQTLLRAAAPPEKTEELLRPARGGADEPSETLLRAAHSPERKE